jgi:predicted peptidase
MKKRWLLGCLVVLLWSSTVSAQQVEKTFRKKVKKTVELSYLLHLPDGYDEGNKDWPLVLFLHGAGERGADLSKLKVHGPPKLIEAGRDIPAIVVSPQCPEDEWWNDHLDALSALLDEIEKKYRVDADRIYVTGLSMGGFGTWALTAREPERFAAAMPICGGGNLIVGLRLLELPLWAFHGDADVVVPVEETTRLVAAIKGRGGEKVKQTIYPGVNHDSWTETYDNAEVWEWLFSQTRSGG